MRALVVLAHPEPQSMNGALFRAAVETLSAAGWTVETSDLFAMGFDPVSDRRNFADPSPGFFKQQAEETRASETGGFAPDVLAEIEKLERADLMIWQFPLHWFALPSILKGWVDRVFVMGRVYGGGRIYETGRFRGRRAMLSLTTGGPAAAYAPDGFNGDIDAILRPVHRGVLEFCGFSVLRPNIVWGPTRATPEDRAAALAAWRERLAGIAGEAPIVVGRY